MKGFMRELLKSRYIRLKIECLLLIIFTIYHSSGIIFLISTHFDSHDDDDDEWIDIFEDDAWGFGLSAGFSGISIIFVWIFTSLIILQYHYKQNDDKWLKIVRIFAKISFISWILSLIMWIASILYICLYYEYFDWTLLVFAIIPSWNKWLPLALLHNIINSDLKERDPLTLQNDDSQSQNNQLHQQAPIIQSNGYTKNQEKRIKRVTSWLNVPYIFLMAYLIGLWLVVILTRLEMMIVLFPIFTIFTTMMWVIYQTKNPQNVTSQMYFICVPCCCCMVIRDGYCECCLPLCCKRNPQRPIVTWLFIGMVQFWLLVNFLLNYNMCMATAATVEWATGFRGAALIIIYYCTLAALDLNYGGLLPKPQIPNQNINNDNNENNGIIVNLNVQKTNEGGANTTGGGDNNNGNIVSSNIVTGNGLVVKDNNDDESDNSSVDEAAVGDANAGVR